ncbi:MAG: AraC family transcriptional regulator [Cyclobacteriaceae bacterium]|nr:AraC family transcriptional regulator [Cyclobacteriaceae bacterium]
MITEDYNKVIESLGIKFSKCNNIAVYNTFVLEDFKEDENVVLLLRRGVLKYGKKEEVKEGHALMIPAKRLIQLSFGNANERSQKVSMDEFRFKQTEFFRQDKEEDTQKAPVCEFTLVMFDTKVFDTVSFFNALDIPPFTMDHPKLNSITYDITVEQNSEEDGNQRVVKLKTEHLVIEIIRYIIKKRLFVEQMATNSTYFKDPRLIQLFKYIKDNLGGELTNKRLAEVADVSEDYVGQYFKTLTGINPQDYIEYQRMEFAVDLLRTTKKSIRDIGRECGYKDTAYFCRRFKMMYGIPAGKMRKRETLMNV